jgi:hypothetical protein
MKRQQIVSAVAAELPAAITSAIVEQAVDDAIMSREEVLRRLTHIARGGMRRVASWGPGGVVFKDSDALPDEDAALVSEVGETINQHGTALRIKVSDPHAALRDLARYYGLDKPAGEGDDGEGPPNRLVLEDPGNG